MGFVLQLIIVWGDFDQLLSHLPETGRPKRLRRFFEFSLPIFAGFQLQIEQGTGLLASKNLRKYWTGIPLTFPLFLTTIVLTNSFKGENIINIIAPADKPFAHFRDLYTNGFTFFSEYVTLIHNSRRFGFSNGAEFDTITDRRFGPTQTYASEISPREYDEIVGRIRNKRKKINNLKMYVEFEEILQKIHGDECPKIAVLGWINDLRLKNEKLNNVSNPKMRRSKSKVVFSLGRQILMTQLRGWKISHIVHDSVHKRVQDLQPFGFLDKILWYQNQSQWLRRRGSFFPQGQTDIVEAVKLDTNMKNVLLYFVLVQVMIIIITGVTLITTKLFASVLIYLLLRQIAVRRLYINTHIHMMYK